MRGRGWLLLGVAAGVAIGAGHVPFLAGSARAVADTLQRLVGSGGNRIVRAVSAHGAPQRAVEGLTDVLTVVVPGTTALLLVAAARGTTRLRNAVSVAVVAVGVAGFFYHPGGVAAGALTLCLAIAAAAVALSGPLVVAPLAALAGLIGTEYLPRLVSTRVSVPAATVRSLDRALFAHDGAPLWLRVAVTALAALPFILAGRLALRG